MKGRGGWEWIEAGHARSTRVRKGMDRESVMTGRWGRKWMDREIRWGRWRENREEKGELGKVEREAEEFGKGW